MYIRVDANEKIATGHVMRCLSIAKQLIKNGEDCTFITADKYSHELINSQGFKTICLNSKWDDLEYETNQLINIINDKQIKKILVDSYYVSEKYLKELKNHTKVIYIDDINNFKYPVDVLINYNGLHEKYNYKNVYKNSQTELLVGYSYIPLREEFCNNSIDVRENVKNVLFTVGGSDSYDISSEFIKKINKNYDGLIYHIIVGRLNKNLEKLKALVSECNNIKLYYSVNNMVEIIKKCDIAISAGGTTLFELCACGIPTISFTIAENQVEGTKALMEKGALIYVGNMIKNPNGCMEMIFKNIGVLIANKVLREELSQKMITLIDGNGSKRIIDEI